MPRTTILCVDDEIVLLNTLSLVLRHHGYHVLKATNATEALALAARSHVDVVLVDHSICDHEKLCLSDLLRQKNPAIKEIMHTGNPEAECLGGRVPFLAKPIEPRRLVEKIEQMLAGGTGDRAPEVER